MGMERYLFVVSKQKKNRMKRNCRDLLHNAKLNFCEKVETIVVHKLSALFVLHSEIILDNRNTILATQPILFPFVPFHFPRLKQNHKLV